MVTTPSTMYDQYEFTPIMTNTDRKCRHIALKYCVLILGCCIMFTIGWKLGSNPTFHIDNKLVSVIVENVEEIPFDSPKIIWLMSFPNSGTSFTSKLVRHVTHFSTASNCGTESLNNESSSMLVYPNTTTGPFWVDLQQGFPYEHPKKYVLTKTHCGGKCQNCGPSEWVQNPHSFKVDCLSGRGIFKPNGRPMDVSYDETLVKKAVHLIRNPFDNVVSRFHLERHHSKSAASYDSSREGFRAFCKLMDKTYEVMEEASFAIDKSILKIMKGVPCHADFFRYAQWHDLAFITTESLRVPTYVLHYELYETKFNETLADLMDFIELPRTFTNYEEFIKGKEYAAYFTLEEREAVKIALKEMTLSITWDNVKHYFQ